MLIDLFHCFLQTTDDICDALLSTEKIEDGSSDLCDLSGQSEDKELGTITNSEDTVVTVGNLSYLFFVLSHSRMMEYLVGYLEINIWCISARFLRICLSAKAGGSICLVTRWWPHFKLFITCLCTGLYVVAT